jgi:hypothetical protein
MQSWLSLLAIFEYLTWKLFTFLVWRPLRGRGLFLPLSAGVTAHAGRGRLRHLRRHVQRCVREAIMRSLRLVGTSQAYPSLRGQRERRWDLR